MQRREGEETMNWSPGLRVPIVGGLMAAYGLLRSTTLLPTRPDVLPPWFGVVVASILVLAAFGQRHPLRYVVAVMALVIAATTMTVSASTEAVLWLCGGATAGIIEMSPRKGAATPLSFQRCAVATLVTVIVVLAILFVV